MARTYDTGARSLARLHGGGTRTIPERIPAVVIDGKLDSCRADRGPDEHALRAALAYVNRSSTWWGTLFPRSMLISRSSGSPADRGTGLVAPVD